MAYIGYEPAKVPLTSADITDNIIVNADINSSAAIAKSKLNLTGSIAIADLSATGTPSSTTFLRGDNTWGSAGAAAGQVIQVLSATDSTIRSTTSTSFVTGSNTLSVSITPSATANKIFVIASVATSVSGDDQDNVITIYRGATNLGTSDGLGSACRGTGTAGAGAGIGGISILDSPSTTSSTTYQIYFKSLSPGTVYLNRNTSNLAQKSSITVMEIKG